MKKIFKEGMGMYCETLEGKKIEKHIAKAKKICGKISTCASVAVAYVYCGMNALAVNIKHDYQVSTTIGDVNPEGLIIGLAVWIARLIGIGMLIWGIYGYVTARKDGEAESMNGALGKLISGLVLVCMPSVLKGLGIIA